jgi:mono-ADP-ribosyltransferase sirtuin 6
MCMFALCLEQRREVIQLGPANQCNHCSMINMSCTSHLHTTATISNNNSTIQLDELITVESNNNSHADENELNSSNCSSDDLEAQQIDWGAVSEEEIIPIAQRKTRRAVQEKFHQQRSEKQLIKQARQIILHQKQPKQSILSAAAAAAANPSPQLNAQEILAFITQHKQLYDKELSRYERNLLDRVRRNDKKLEKQDEEAQLEHKVNQLIELMRKSQYIVVHTGAGISTNAGIKDFRGPQGLWRNYDKAPSAVMKAGLELCTAHPTYTHFALATLFQIGIIKHIITQNVDGLHNSTGIPQQNLTNLHGNIYIERCEDCEHSYYKDFDVRRWKSLERPPSPEFHYTGRQCTQPGIGNRAEQVCNGPLRDTLIYLREYIVDQDLVEAYKHSIRADLSIVLGSSLSVPPASTLPLLAKRPKPPHIINPLHKPWAKLDKFTQWQKLYEQMNKHLRLNLNNGENHSKKRKNSEEGNSGDILGSSEHGALVIVNKQWTAKDRSSAIKLHSDCDYIMRKVIEKFKLTEQLQQIQQDYQERMKQNDTNSSSSNTNDGSQSNNTDNSNNTVTV